MFRSRTLFIIGAGASFEAGLPTGEALKYDIADKLSIKFKDGFRQSSGDFAISQSVREYLAKKGDDGVQFNKYLHCAWQICDAMPQAISIDNFLDAHRGNEAIELCGKLAIVRSILDAEKRSKLYIRPERNDPLDFKSLTGTWYNSFVQLLTEGVSIVDIDKIFDNVSLVTFNYDRCVEHFLVHSMRNYYAVEEKISQDLLKRLRIIHPYGTVGGLPWQIGAQQGVAFGGSQQQPSILDISRQLKTFTERTHEEAELKAIWSEVENAEVIVFLGFAFHKQNMDLLKPTGSCKAKRVFATAYGISKNDCEVVKQQIYDLFLVKPQHLQLELRNDLKCNGLFSEYWRSLSLV